jgi:hypothetical protein
MPPSWHQPGLGSQASNINKSKKPQTKGKKDDGAISWLDPIPAQASHQ